MFNLVEGAKLVELLAPATDAAGRTGDYVTLKDAARAYIVVHIAQGNAATVAISPKQASAVAGTGVKAISACRIWANQDTASSDTLVAQTSAVSFTTSAALANKLVVFEVDAASLDVSNGFDCLTVVTGASNAANLTQATVVLVGHRYQGATPPSAIVD